MKSKRIIIFRAVLVLVAMAFFNSGCGLIESMVRALAGYCAIPEWVVTRFDDPARGGLCNAEDCSLRKAVQTSNACPGTQTIRLPAGTYALSLAGIEEDGNRTGDLDITDSVNIISDGMAVIDGSDLDRVLDIISPAHATLTSITITNGSRVDGGGIRNTGTLTMLGGAIQENDGRRGGGLFNLGTAALDSVMIQDNLADRGSGSGIYNEGNLSLTHGAILRNTGSLDFRGGGLFNAGTAVLDDVNVGGNIVDLEGGGIFNSGSLTVTGGYVQENIAGRSGAGLHNDAEGILDLTRVSILENRLESTSGLFGIPTSEGAGLANEGQASIDGCLINYNRADHSRGGGIVNYGTLSVRSSTLEWNTAFQGAGLFNYGSAVVDGSTINNNTVTGFDIFAGAGGGIFNQYQASLSITNSTISSNVALRSGSLDLAGAGIYNEGSAEVSSVTFTGNNPDGLYSGLPGIDGEAPLVGPPQAKLRNTIIAANITIDCNGTTIVSQGNNLDGDNSCRLTSPGDLPGLEPHLDPLASNGGPTLTHALQSASPARDTGASCPATDQRGVTRPRPAGGACDIGAYEYDPANTNVPEPTATPAAASAPMFTFDRQANCRLGPNTLYASVGIGEIGHSAQIEGISDPAGWYYVLLPDGITRCFVAGSTGTVTGPVDGLPVVPAPPLPVAPLAPELNVSTQICDSSKYVVRLSWKDVADEYGYRVYRDGVLIASLGADITFFDDTSPDFESHSYMVEAFNDSGSTGSTVKASEGCVY